MSIHACAFAASDTITVPAKTVRADTVRLRVFIVDLLSSFRSAATGMIADLRTWIGAAPPEGWAESHVGAYYFCRRAFRAEQRCAGGRLGGLFVRPRPR